MREVGIGIAGFGTVGGGVLSILRDHAADIEARLGARIVVKKIALRNPEKERPVDVDPRLVTTRLEDLLSDPAIAVVVELIGGVDQAFDPTSRARISSPSSSSTPMARRCSTRMRLTRARRRISPPARRSALMKALVMRRAPPWG